MKLDGLSLFFPCHNEEANVEGLLNDVLHIVPRLADPYEVIIVDDGSRDRTSEIVQRFCDQGYPVRLVRHGRRQGYGEALKSGFRAARYPWVFYSDGDRQFDLGELPELLGLTKKSDIISGYRRVRADPWYRTMNAGLFSLALKTFFGLSIPDVNCAFKLYRRDLLSQIQLNTSGALINAEIFSKAKRLGYRISLVGVSHKPRLAGRQTGAQPKVILKAMREFLALWWELHHHPHEAK